MVLQPLTTPIPDAFNAECPWQRQPFDCEASWPIFLQYLQQFHPRSLDPLEWAHGPRVKHYARDKCWVARATAYDNYIIGEHNRSLTLFTVEQARRNADHWTSIYADLIWLIEDQLGKYLIMAKAQTMPGTVKINELTKLLEFAFKLDQLRSGGATERIEISAAKEIIDTLGYEQLEALGELQKKLLK